MALSANMKTALERSSSGHAWVLELDVPGGIRRYSEAGYSSLARGHYLGRVLSWGAIQRTPTEAEGTLSAVQTQVTIDDTSREWAQLVEGASAESVQGSAATIYLAHPDVAFADWSTIFAGEIARKPWPGPLQASIVLRTSDRSLRSKVLRPAWEIQGIEFPEAPQDSLNQFAGLLYGIHNSIFTTEEGMVPAPRVGAGQYLLSAGWLKEVSRVYEDGSETVPSDYSITHPIIGGKLYTRIDFDSDPGVSVVVTADVQGYEATGDGSGVLIEDPPDQLAHALSNFIVGDWRQGDWLATNAIVDAASFATTFFSDRGYSGSRHISQQVQASELLRGWADSIEVRMWWTPAGTLAIGVEDPTETSIYQSDPWLRWERHALTPFKLSARDHKQTSDMLIHYAQGAVSGGYLQSLELVEPNAPVSVPVAYNQPWSSAQ